MLRTIAVCFVITIGILLPLRFAAAETFESTWKSSDAESVNMAGKKVAALVLAKNRAARAAAEDLLAEKITLRGGIGIAGNTLVTESDLEDKEKVKSLLEQAGVSGAVVMRTLLAGGKHAGPDVWKDPQYRHFMGFSPEPGPFGDKKEKFYVEVMVYSLEQDRLLWAGKSATKASTVDELITNMVEATAERLNQEGLIKKN